MISINDDPRIDTVLIRHPTEKPGEEELYKILTKGLMSPSCHIEVNDEAIFMFQCISVGHFKLNLFFDGGCSDMVITKRALDIFMKLSRAKLITEGPLMLRGVGDIKSVCPYGRFQISIPLHNGREATLTGICLDKVTSTFDEFSLKLAEQDLREQYVREGGDPSNLPKLLEFVGGDTDIMIGIKNNKYFPRELMMHH